MRAKMQEMNKKRDAELEKIIGKEKWKVSQGDWRSAGRREVDQEEEALICRRDNFR
ncbi:MAG: hypothetical protein R2744_02570 [Bacteroidales bacterium]